MNLKSILTETAAEAAVNNVTWGIIGTGRIAHSMAKALSMCEGAKMTAAASRDKERGASFCRQWNIPVVYDSYEALIDDPSIDAVYIATPHVSHEELSIAAMNSGKHVLCEKPAAVNAGCMRRIAEASKKNGTFFMEAMWSKFHPAFIQAMNWIREGKIGDVQTVICNFCINRPNKPAYESSGYSTHRLYDAALAGGALLDVGIYPLTLAVNAVSAAFGVKPYQAVPLSAVSSARIGSTGVDLFDSMSLVFSAGGKSVNAHLSCAIDTECGDDFKYAYICGTKGTIRMPFFWNCTSIEVCASDGTVTESKELLFDVNGYEYEAREVIHYVSALKNAGSAKKIIESPIHSHSDSIALLTLMDSLRAQWNLVYPFEKNARAVRAKPAPDGNQNLVIYTDGACSGNPGPGGWGAVLLDSGNAVKLYGGERGTTNNRMELTAAIEALRAASKEPFAGRPVSVYIDSQYVKNGITTWIAGWKRNGWKTANKEPVKNKDLWEMLDALVSRMNVRWVWVKGHAGSKYNEMCDELARKGAEESR